VRDQLQADKVLSASLGSTIELFEKIINKDLDNGLIFVNNQSNIHNHLVQYAIDRHNMKRVLVIDWDSDHNLTVQKSFYDSNKVLHISVHRWSMSPTKGDFDWIGDENARGYNLNIPLTNVIFF
jgi:hypothetical protein